MNWDNWKQIFVMIIGFLILLILPLFWDFYYKNLYYIGIILLIPVTVHRILWKERYDQKFFDKWHKAREQGFKINLAREAAKGSFLMILMVVIGQFFGNGQTPLDIVLKLRCSVLVWLLLLLMAFGIALGVAAWHQNEKKYCRIYFKRKKQQEK